MAVVNNPQAFTARLLAAMVKRGHGHIRAAELADVIAGEIPQGVSVQTTYKWLTGGAIPKGPSMAALARWLGVSEQWLRYGPVPDTEDAGSTPLQTNMSTAKELERRISALPYELRVLLETLIDQLEKVPR